MVCFCFCFCFSLHVSKNGPIPSPLDHVSAPQWTKHLLIPLKPQDFVLVNINLRKSLQAFDLRVALFLHVSNIHLTTMFLTISAVLLSGFDNRHRRAEKVEGRQDAVLQSLHFLLGRPVWGPFFSWAYSVLVARAVGYSWILIFFLQYYVKYS